MILTKNKEKIISNLIINEVIAVLNIKLKQDSNILLKVHEKLNKDYEILNDTEFHNKGLKILINELNKNNKRLSFFDCIYIALMQELGIKEIATFDKHFNNIDGIERIH